MIKVGQYLEHGIYAPSPPHYLDQFETAIKGKRFLDLGSGRGEIVQKALSLGADAYGIEIEDELVMQSCCPDRIIHGNLFTVDLSQYEVLYYYLSGTWNEGDLLKKIIREFRGFLICYSG